LPAPALTPEQRRAEAQAAWQEAVRTATQGPADVTLLDQAKLHLQPGTMFIPQGPASRLLRAWGNTPGTDMIGMVNTLDDKQDWAVVVRFIKDGYIKEDDAKDWNAADLLQSLKEGTEEANATRRSRGFRELVVLGWIQPPTYDATTHRLVWSLASRHKDDDAGATQGVNYNTYALGRDGYISLNLLTNTQDVAHDTPVVTTLLSNLTYLPGKAYSDYNASTDRMAEYGLAALVGVVAAKKLGLIALGGLFLAKFAKIILIGLAAVTAGAVRLFKGRKGASS
jgi:uncharacterized membrane-anchored protein